MKVVGFTARQRQARQRQHSTPVYSTRIPARAQHVCVERRTISDLLSACTQQTQRFARAVRRQRKQTAQHSAQHPSTTRQSRRTQR